MPSTTGTASTAPLAEDELAGAVIEDRDVGEGAPMSAASRTPDGQDGTRC